jgi:8-oxo-dGTP pyrophosphatase MutT (NUDIX family)/catechol 2,3-dioxygenase-like lactoylglutathione lyase family enzyme
MAGPSHRSSTPPAEEQVALYGADGRPTGEAVPRSEMRARNLRHAATLVVVRNSAGDVYVHRRTDTKDVFPGRYDFAAGGVLQAGEDPYDAAVREAAEELGVTGVELHPLGEADYADAHTTYHAFAYTCVYDGPITWQPEEVAWGAWVGIDRLREMVATEVFVPDSLAVLGERLLDEPPAWESRDVTSVTSLATAMFTVADQDAAVAFYTGPLGWDLRSDVAFGEGDMAGRWVEVAPPGSVAVLSLNIAWDGSAPGGGAVGVEATDVLGERARLEQAGVPVGDLMGGEGAVPLMFSVADADGNTIWVVAAQPVTPEA